MKREKQNLQGKVEEQLPGMLFFLFRKDPVDIAEDTKNLCIQHSPALEGHRFSQTRHA